ncbi:gephyrin-like molybdotransferase Glp [Paenibacillus hamazuiensis]|uniref:molybdopterin molybdotransferase MoeA n=1 Tax=Paenibacillus hamazuiensis TaxID=2936508 RepID=UPI00200C5A3D|nr:gephyrin-like molybdotransferase Glp [Paenibacillus hamazuiensis]
MKFQREIVQVEEAQRRILRHAAPLPAERVPLAESFGRRLAEPVAADHPVPHFRRSGVDGYAVIAADTEHAAPDSPATLDVVELIMCGSVPSRRLGPGQAARIMTGAVVPEGADAVIMLEMTDSMDAAHSGGAGEPVRVKKRMAPGDNVTPVGREVQAREQVLEPGRVIRAGEAAVLATFGVDPVPVYRQPKVAIFSTGSELLPVHEPLSPGKIRNSNSYMLAAQVREAGGLPFVMPVLPDDADAVLAALERAFREADAVITTGGVSVGDKDVLVDVFARWSGEMLFNKVAMRPGSPTTVGLLHGKPLFALSGNPGASFVGFELFVRPYLRSLLGEDRVLHAECAAFLDVSYDKGSAYPRYVRGTMTLADGQVRVRPAGHDKSSIMVSIKDADCLIHIPAGGRGAARDERVRVLRLQ